MNHKKPGEYLADVVGPLGNPTDLDDAKTVCVVAGGSGCAIGFPVIRELHNRGVDVDAVIGFRNKDLVILENVGNLVCPAEFDTGAAINVMILSVPEGHDKPLKYPLVFQVCDAMIVNKIDVLPYFDFDMDKVTEYAKRRNPNIRIFPISAKTGEGVEALAQWMTEQVYNWKQK